MTPLYMVWLTLRPNVVGALRGPGPWAPYPLSGGSTGGILSGMSCLSLSV